MPAEALVGRRLVVDALRSAVDAAVAGTGGVVLLAGEAGMGKTALAADAAAYARGRGATVVWGTCWEGEGAPGYWPWIQVVRALAHDENAGGAAGAGDAVLAGLTGASEPWEGVLGEEAAARFRTYDTTAAYVCERAASRPLVLVLDDLHSADVSSLRMLAFLARQLHDTPALVVGTYRDVEVMFGEHPARDLLGELAGQSEVLQLAGLTADDVGQLLGAVCEERPSAAMATAVHERTGGNPFFVRQTARLLAAQGVSLDHASVAGVPGAVGDLLARRLARLPEGVMDLLAIAAVAGRRFPVTAIADIGGLPIEDAVSLLDTAVRAGVVEHDVPGTDRFSHDLFREVIYEGLPTARRSALHLSVAGLLERDTDVAASAAQIAYHRTAALPLGDQDLAIAALAEAAWEATARTAFDEAAGHLRRAVSVAGGPAAADLGMLCGYGDALRRAGNGEDARSAFLAAARRARAAHDTAVLARAAFGLHRVTTLTESSRSDVIALLEEALAASGSQPPATRSMLSASLARELADGPEGDRPRAAALAAAAVDGARAFSVGDGRAGADGRTLAYALFALGDVSWEPGSAIERLRIAGELASVAAAAGETELLLEAHLARLAALLEAGDPAFASQLDTFARLAADSAIPRYMYLARSREATLASLTGPFELADELIASAARYGDRIGEPDTWAVQASQLIGLAMLRHDWTRISALATARGLPLTPPEMELHERAWPLIESGDREAAASLVATLPDRQAVYRWRQAALLAGDAELVAAVADQRRCAALYEQLQPLAGQFAVVAAAVVTTGPVALQLGLLAAALGRWDEAARHLDEAVVLCDRLGARLHGDRARAELERVLAARAVVPGPGTREPNEFRRDGSVWTLSFAGRRVQLPDAKGLRDLAVLLSAPGHEVASVELVAGGAQLAGPLGADLVLDERARAEYRARLAELDEELAEADARSDIERSARIADERDALIGELARATGLHGRRRRLGDSAERARTTVTARIRDAISRIERVHPELGRHLRATIFTGSRCAYRPSETVRWQISRL